MFMQAGFNPVFLMGLKVIFLFLIICFLFSFVFDFPVHAQNLLNNGDFESQNLEPWSSSGGGAQATISSQLFYDGQFSLKVSHTKVSSYGFQQVITDLESGMFYQVRGFGSTDDNNTASYFLRVAWYESNDGSGSQLTSPTDSGKGDKIDGSWSSFDLLVQAPDKAHSAKLRLVLNSKENDLLASAYFDNLVFTEAIAPTPTPTLTPTPKPTSTSTPTPTPTPTPTLAEEVLGVDDFSISPIPTLKAVKLAATFSGEVLSSDIDQSLSFYPLDNEASKTASSSGNSNQFIFRFFLAFGFIILGLSASWLCYNWYCSGK